MLKIIFLIATLFSLFLSSGCTVVEFENPFVKEEGATPTPELFGVWEMEKCIKDGKEESKKPDKFSYAIVLPAKEGKFWISLYSDNMKLESYKAYCGEAASRKWLMINIKGSSDKNFPVNLILPYELKGDQLTVFCLDNKIFEDAVEEELLSGEEIEYPNGKVLRIKDDANKLLSFYLEHMQPKTEPNTYFILKRSQLDWKKIKKNVENHATPQTKAP